MGGTTEEEEEEEVTTERVESREADGLEIEIAIEGVEVVDETTIAASPISLTSS